MPGAAGDRFDDAEPASPAGRSDPVRAGKPAGDLCGHHRAARADPGDGGAHVGVSGQGSEDRVFPLTTDPCSLTSLPPTFQDPEKTPPPKLLQREPGPGRRFLLGERPGVDAPQEIV